MKALVYGGRDFRNQRFLEQELDKLDITTIVHGDARGADRMAGNWAKQRGIPCEVYPADWNRDGKQAGFIRNARMLEQSKPDILVGFPGGSGTRHMTNLGKAKGFRILLLDPRSQKTRAIMAVA